METEASRYARSLIEASLDPLVTISAEGKIMDMNQATADIIGLTREQITDSDFFDYFTEPQKAREVYKEVFAKGSVADSPLTLRHKNGKLTDVLFNGSVYKDDDGNVLGVVIVARDIAEQKWASELRKVNQQLEFQNNEKEKRADELILANKELVFQNNEKEKRAQELILANKELVFQNNEKEKRAAELIIADKELVYQKEEKEKRKTEKKALEELSYSIKLASQYSLSLIEASRDPLITISPKGKITDMNQATANIIGLSREHITDSDFFDYFTEPKKAREVYKEVFAKGSVADFPLTLKHKNGKLTDVLFNGSVYKDDDGKVLGVVIVARDVTDQKRIATELTEAKEHAEEANAVAQEARKNAQISTRKAEDAVKAKQQFLSNMSHEIRTPMNAIIGFTKVLLKSDLSVKQMEYLSAIKLSGDALIVLINDILDLAKVDAGKMSFERIPFRMELSIFAMLHLFETKIQEKNLKLKIKYDNDIPKVLLGDPVRLHQIILNLVSNALKFTNKGCITVAVKLVSEDLKMTTVQANFTNFIQSTFDQNAVKDYYFSNTKAEVLLMPEGSMIYEAQEENVFVLLSSNFTLLDGDVAKDGIGAWSRRSGAVYVSKTGGSSNKGIQTVSEHFTDEFGIYIDYNDTNNFLYHSLVEYTNETLTEVEINHIEHTFICNITDIQDNHMRFGYNPFHHIPIRKFSNNVEEWDIYFGIPNYAVYSEKYQTYRWRHILEIGYFEVGGNGIDFPYMNDAFYVFSHLLFNIKNYSSPKVNSLLTGGYLISSYTDTLTQSQSNTATTGNSALDDSLLGSNKNDKPFEEFSGIVC